jgi:hypothetical protein
MVGNNFAGLVHYFPVVNCVVYMHSFSTTCNAARRQPKAYAMPACHGTAQLICEMNKNMSASQMEEKMVAGGGIGEFFFRKPLKINHLCHR